MTERNTYRQVKDVLDRIRSFYRQLADYIEESSEYADDERLKLLLEQVRWHEENLNRCLAKYEKTAADAVLNTWLQYVPDEALERVFQNRAIPDDAALPETIRTALDFDEALSNLYEQLADANVPPRVQEVFASLAELQRGREKQFAWSVQEFQDEGTA